MQDASRQLADFLNVPFQASGQVIKLLAQVLAGEAGEPAHDRGRAWRMDLSNRSATAANESSVCAFNGLTETDVDPQRSSNATEASGNEFNPATR
jgi:hypothetical protein